MKLKKLLAAASTVLELSLVALIILLCLTYVFTGGDERDVRQNLNYTESTEKINNPDQGFYRPISVKVTESGATYNGNIITASTQLYHLRIDISAFSGAANGTADKLLTQEALSGVEGLLALLKTTRKSAVVRFAYDPYYGGKADMEPALQTLLEHIKQVCPVLNKFPLTITAVEAGMVGPWGEMHTSKVATPQHYGDFKRIFKWHAGAAGACAYPQNDLRLFRDNLRRSRKLYNTRHGKSLPSGAV